MSKTISIFLLSFTLLTVLSCNKKEDDKPVGTLQLSSIKVGSSSLNLTGSSSDIAIDSDFILSFSAALDANAANQSITLNKGTLIVPITGLLSEDGKEFTLTPSNEMEFNNEYVINIAESLKGANGESFPGIQVHFTTEMSNLELVSIKINNKDFENPLHPKDVQFDDLKIEITFSDALESENISQHFSLFPNPGIQVTLSEDKKTVTVTNTGDMDYYRKHSFQISSSLQSTHEANYTGYSNYFITGLDPSYKFPLISDEALLDLVQQQTFKYFWDFAHPSSGMTRERNTSGDVVTVGGSGFGIMAIPIGIERGFITRQQGISHLDKVTDFLSTADRFHGVWPHWLNGNTGQVHPFSTNDNGADLVETSYMAAGLITVRQYLDPTQSEELLLINRINTLLSEIEWDWYTRGGQDVLYWHWSPNLGWVMNMQVRGYNEALITYFMAATSTTFPIEASVYHKGWANNGAIANGRSFYGIPLPVGYDYGGPLFFSHYSFLGLNPTGLEDQYANYWTQNVNHSLINREHCVLNPRGHLGYSADCWGLTASDEPTGYGVHEPTRDNGTITPSAALSSIPYTPEESMDAMRHFYFILGDKLWGEYGFKDAFNPDISWWASSYLAIDQGPIIIMIENYRTGLCWDLFMSAPEVQTGMNKLGFSR